MSKIYKEIGIGFIPVLLIFLVFLGVNVIPILFVSVLGVSLFYMIKGRGGAGISAGGDRKSKNRTPSYLTFDEIGGQDRAKKELMEALDFLIKHEEIKKLGIRPLKGILLTGPPGTGKTLMAKAAAHYTNSCLLYTSPSPRD